MVGPTCPYLKYHPRHEMHKKVHACVHYAQTICYYPKYATNGNLFSKSSPSQDRHGILWLLSVRPSRAYMYTFTRHIFTNALVVFSSPFVHTVDITYSTHIHHDILCLLLVHHCADSKYNLPITSSPYSLVVFSSPLCRLFRRRWSTPSRTDWPEADDHRSFSSVYVRWVSFLDCP